MRNFENEISKLNEQYEKNKVCSQLIFTKVITYLYLRRLDFENLDEKKSKFTITDRYIDIELISKNDNKCNLLISLYEDYFDLYAGKYLSTFYDYARIVTESEISDFEKILSDFFSKNIVEKVTMKNENRLRSDIFIDKVNLKEIDYHVSYGFPIFRFKKKIKLYKYKPWVLK